VQQSAEPQRLASREVVGQRFRQYRSGCLGVLAQGRGIALQLDELRQRVEGVAVDVEVVVLRLIHPLLGRQLGQHRLQGSQRVEQGDTQPGRRGGSGDYPLELDEHALGRNVGDSRRRAPGRVADGGIEVEAELDRQAGQSQHPQRVGVERIW
jgi:hypothetical protein